MAGRRLSRRRGLEREVPLAVTIGFGLGRHVDAHALVTIVSAVGRQFGRPEPFGLNTSASIKRDRPSSGPSSKQASR